MSKGWPLAALTTTLILVTGAWAVSKFSKKQMAAGFYFDLGPDSIDVPHYPQKQQESYHIFAKTCSQCHTLARPINAPFISRKDWSRFIHRMQFNAKVRPWAKLSKGDLDRILDFLVYDSNIRKVKGAEAFKKRTRELQDLFEDIQAEKKLEAKKKAESQTVKPLPPDNGASTSPPQP